MSKWRLDYLTNLAVAYQLFHRFLAQVRTDVRADIGTNNHADVHAKRSTELVAKLSAECLK